MIDTWAPTGRPPLGSSSRMRRRSSDLPSSELRVKMRGTEVRLRRKAAYRGR